MIPARPVLFFDFDGTLADSMGLCVAQLQETYRAMNLPMPPAELLKKCNGPSYEEAAYLLGVPEELHKTFCEVRWEKELQVLPDWQRLFPGVTDMLHDLHPMAQLIIASNGKKEYLEKSLSQMGISEYFHRVASGVPGRTKGEIVGAILQEIGPCRALIAGDRLVDIRAGKENGILTVVARYGYGSSEEWREADKQAGSVDELWKICKDFCHC